jgi:hypothetical protein
LELREGRCSPRCVLHGEVTRMWGARSGRPKKRQRMPVSRSMRWCWWPRRASERASAGGVPDGLERIGIGSRVKGMASVAGPHRATA